MMGERLFIFASGENVDADVAYHYAWKQLQQRMKETHAEDLVELDHSTAVIPRPIEVINPLTNEPEISEYPHILITLHATVYTTENQQ